MFIPLPEQIWGIALFILGNAILTLAGKLELHEVHLKKDRRPRTAVKPGENPGMDSNPLEKRKFLLMKRKLLMSALGFGLGAFGVLLFFRSFY